jgi:hypothetical protein
MHEAELAEVADGAFDAFMDRAVEDGLLSVAELDRLTDRLAQLEQGGEGSKAVCTLNVLEPLLPPGSVLMLHGLKTQPELNGARALMLDYPASRPTSRTELIGKRICHLLHFCSQDSIRRYPVRLPAAGKCIRVKPQNLRPWTVVQAGTPPELSADIWQAILGLLLPWQRVAAVARVCKEWHALVHVPALWEYVAVSLHAPQVRALRSQLSRIPGHYDQDWKPSLGRVPTGTAKRRAAIEAQAQLLMVCHAGALPVHPLELTRIHDLAAVRTLFVVDDVGWFSEEEVRQLCSAKFTGVKAVHFVANEFEPNADENDPRWKLLVRWIDRGLPKSLEHLHVEEGEMLLHLLDAVYYTPSWKARYRRLKTVGALLPYKLLAEDFHDWTSTRGLPPKIETLDVVYPNSEIMALDEFLAGFPRLKRLRVESSDHLLDVADELFAGCGERVEALCLHVDSQEGLHLSDWEEAFNSTKFPRLRELVVMMDSCEFLPDAGSELITQQLEKSLPGSRLLVSSIDESPCSTSYGFRSQGGTGAYVDPAHDIFFPGLLEIWQTHPFARGPLRMLQSKQDQRLAPLLHAVTAGVQ